MKERLTRTEGNKIIAGVCAGIARYLGWDTVKVRLLYGVLSVFSGVFIGIIIYLILWIMMPKE